MLCFQTASNSIPYPQPPPHPNIASATYSSIAVRQAYSSRVHSTSRQPSASTQPPLLRIRCSNNTGCLGFDLAESIYFQTPILWILKGPLDGLTVPKRCCLIPSLEGWRWGGGQGLSEVVPSILCCVTSCLKGVSWGSPLADAEVKTCHLFCSQQLCYSSRHLLLCLWLNFGAHCTTDGSMIMSLL